MRRIGARPLLARYVLHKAETRWRRRRLRSTYFSSVAQPRGGAEIEAPALELPRIDELPASLAAAAALIRDEADAILGHRVDFLGSGLVPLGERIDWHLDFKSGFRWPEVFYQDVEITRLGDSSDAKVPWELSRGHHFLTLARAARLYGDERYAAELERQLDDWLSSNPPGIGINWTNPMEVALRAVNWVWAIRTLEGLRPLTPELQQRVVHSLQVHGRHIAANLEGTPYLRSNHYLSDLLGLVVLGATLRGDPEAARWLEFARRELEHEIMQQVCDDGVSFEASLSYHGLALELFLIARVAASWAGRPLSRGFDERVAAMLAVSRSLRHPDGRIPLFGDGDSGRVLPAGFARPPTHDNLLWLGAAQLRARRPLTGAVHEEVAWTLGLGSWQGAGAAPPAQETPPSVFPDGGLFVLRGRDGHAAVRCGGVGQNGNGGHAHNDALSYELSFRGAAIVVDSGTFVYTSDPRARNAFRSTRAHSTVVVDGEEINPIARSDLFRLRQVAHPRVERWQEGPDAVELVASHDGYRRLPGGVIHRRTVRLEGPVLSVDDELTGRGQHAVESLVHLAPEAEARVNGGDRIDVGAAGMRLRITFRDFGGTLELERGRVSDRYGVSRPATVAVAREARELPLRIGYSIELLA